MRVACSGAAVLSVGTHTWRGGKGSRGEGSREDGLCAQQGRNGATEKGAGDNHSIPGLVTRGLLIMQPKGVVLACQSCPERWHGKPHKGVCVHWV